MLHTPIVRPVRVYEDDAQLRVRVAHGVGYRAVCRCGWQGRVRSTFRQARGDLYAHRSETGG